ncbi:MAG: hypothetical protein K0R71_1813 [Bacillales bacterium]|jgi:hypothetical protein|nr:hypothetical protein [Bacillales bacterium]
MKSFRLKVKLRLIGSILSFLIGVFFSFLVSHPELLEQINFYNSDALLGPTFYILIFSVIYIFKNYRLLESKDELRETFIKENDERSILIHSKALSSTYNVSLYILGPFFILLGRKGDHKIIANTLFIMALYGFLVRFAVNKYFTKKYSE